MIRLSDSLGLSAFGLRTAHEAALPADPREAASSIDGEFLGGTTSIGSDLNAAARGWTVAQHAANVLSHVLCRNES
jgi:hypothetical protein